VVNKGGKWIFNKCVLMCLTPAAIWNGWFLLVSAILGLSPAVVNAVEQAGSIRGMVYDSDFDAPLGGAKVTLAETEQTAVTSDEGNYILNQVAPGTYTLIFAKDGYTRQVKADVVVSPGQMTEVNASLSGEFEEMEEFVVQDVQIGTGTEAALLDLRMESPALLDSVSADLMSRAGASDAASALNLVAGATVSEGKYATVRGLPDRYVNSQMNGVRLPTADADKRAVELDQFPAAIIESIQVSKTFTPDQQGDASGGAVNIVLKGIPQERVFKISTQAGYNTNVKSAGSDFLTYKGGGVSPWGKDDGDRDIPANFSFAPPAGVSYMEAPNMDYKWSLSMGDKWDFDDFRIGAFGSFFYERSNSYSDDGINDHYWVIEGQDHVEPQNSGSVSVNDFNYQRRGFTTSLFDVLQASQEVKWGGLGAFGLETEGHSLNFVYVFTRSAEDKTTLAEDTRGKAYYFPGYDVNDPSGDGNTPESERNTARYLRFETLQYTERTTDSVQLSGRHELADLDFGFKNIFKFLTPRLDWYLSISSAGMLQPDKRYFASNWKAPRLSNGVLLPAVHNQQRVGENIALGNYQRTWKEISEDSDQFGINLKLPFEQWSGDEGYLKFGLFDDQVTRTYEQESFSNDSAGVAGFEADWNTYWSSVFHTTNPANLPEPSDLDVDYDGRQSISAWYSMFDLPLVTGFNAIGGVRFEETELSITNQPESFAGIPLIRKFQGEWFTYSMTATDKGDVDLKQQDTLPMIGFVFEPWAGVTARGTYAETVARPTFKELSPIAQQEYLGGDVFVGNPDLKMAALKNYDLRLDWKPYDSGLVSVSWFHKDIENTIEYVKAYSQSVGTFTIPVNYPEGTIDGYEFEFRQTLGRFWESLEGFSLGANATLIKSEVTLPDDELQRLRAAAGANPQRAPKTRDMVNTPEHLYNFYVTYEIPKYETQLSLFYTIRGDTLVAGTGVSDKEAYRNIVPDIYETEFGTLNFSLSHKLGEIWTLKFQAKNLLDPKIRSVYRDPIDGDITHSSYRKGMDFSISLSATF
jgi:TonB-dependent receptor